LWSTRKKLAVAGGLLSLVAGGVVAIVLFGSSPSSPQTSPTDSVPVQPVTTPPADGSVPVTTDLSPAATTFPVKPELTDDPSRTASFVLPRAFFPPLAGRSLNVILADSDDYAVYVFVRGIESAEHVAATQASYLDLFGETEREQVSPSKVSLTAKGTDQGVEFSATLNVEAFPDGVVISGTVRAEGDPEPLSGEERADLDTGEWEDVWAAVAARLGAPAPTPIVEEPPAP
jgi:hypothetical protein